MNEREYDSMNPLSFLSLVWIRARLMNIIGAMGIIGMIMTWENLSAATVTQMFGQALKVYESGNYRSATKLLFDIVKKYPTHEPSHLLLARISYRQGQMVRAAHHFRKVSPDLLESEAAYEYGITFFARGECKEAEAGLKRVGSGFRGANLAAFYRGICFSRNREWFRAELQFEKAINLPEHLIGIRRRLLNDVRTAQQDERNKPIDSFVQQVPPPQPVITVPPPPYEYSVSEKEAKSRTPQTKVIAKKDGTKSGLSTTVSPNLGLNLKSTDKDFNGSKTSHSDSNIVTLGAELTLKQVFAPVKSGDQPSISVPLGFSYKAEDTQGKSTVRQAFNDTPDQPFDVTISDPKRSVHMVKGTAQPEVNYPVLKTLDLIAKGIFEYIQVQEETIPSAQGYGGSGSLVFGLGTFSLKITGEFMQYQVDNRKDPNQNGFNRMKGSLAPSYNWANGFYIEGNGTFTNYEQFTQKPPGGTGIEDVNADINGTTFDGTALELGANAGKKFAQAKIQVGGKQTIYTPSAEDRFMSGASQIFTIDGSLEFNFEVGATLTLSGSNSQIMAYKTSINKPKDFKPQTALQDPAPEKILVNGEGTKSSGKTALKFTPIDGLSGTLSASFARQQLSTAEEILTEAINNESPTSATTIGFEISYNKAF